jgi:hypothetical protein
MSNIVVGGQATRVPPYAPSPTGRPTAPETWEQGLVDAHTLAATHANGVLIGDPFVLRGLLGTVWPLLKKSVVWIDSARLSLPIESCGTLILEEAHRLSEPDQAHLLAWLNDGGRMVQVLTTSSRPLFPLVEAASFLEPLYYRLNRVLISVP